MRSLTLLLASLLALPAVAQSPAFPADANTVALYTFDGTNPDTTFDVSGNGHHAFNEGTTSAPGRHGDARQFDGVDDRIDMDAVRVALQGATAWTLEYIARSEDSASVPILLSHTCSNGWRLHASGGSARYAVKTTTSGGFCDWNPDETLSIPALGNEWHYLALAFGDGALRFYLDGHLQGSQGASGVFQGSAGGQRAWIGHSDFSAGAYYAGLADELRVSHVARSGAEICATADELGWACAPTPIEPDVEGLLAFALHAPAPNPFGTRAAIDYDVPEAGRVRVAVYDVLGRAVAVLVDGEQPAGRHEAALDGGALASGVYLVRMTAADGFMQVQRVTLLR